MVDDERERGDPAAPAGDASAERFIGRHQANLWRYLRFLGCEAAAAEDLCQEAFLSALAHRIESRPDGTAESWLRTTARNLYRMQLRRLRRQGEVARLDELDLAFDAHARPDRGETYLRALRACLGTLDRRAHEALELRYRNNASRAAMAAALELTEEGVKTLLRRARAQLRACIETRRQER